MVHIIYIYTVYIWHIIDHNNQKPKIIALKVIMVKDSESPGHASGCGPENNLSQEKALLVELERLPSRSDCRKRLSHTHAHTHTHPWFYWIQSQSKQPTESSALFRALNQKLGPCREERTRGEVAGLRGAAAYERLILSLKDTDRAFHQ